VKLDVTFGIRNDGNTLTPYTVDFAVADDVVLDLLANGLITAQLIAWQDKQIQDVQFCDPQIITENRIIAVANDPNLFTLQVPDITDNRLGELTYFIASGDILQNTLRFIGRRDAMETLAERLENDIISFAFTSQAANTGETELVDAREQIINDREPAVFNFADGDVVTFDATSSAGAVIPTDLVIAFRRLDPVPVNCSPALGSTVGLDIFNGLPGPTPVLCSAVTDSGVVSTVQLFVSVVDNDPPSIDAGTVPADIVAEVGGPGGAGVSYTPPTATDANGIDPSVDVVCDPAPGSTFPFAPPSSTTTVTCTASDDSGNTDTATFNVTVSDTTPPTFVDAPLPTVVAEASDASGAVVSFTLPTVSDIGDAAPAVNCAPASGSLFSLGTTAVTCTATDASGNSAAETFDVEVEDTTPPIITLNGDNPFVVEGATAYVDPGANVTDAVDSSITIAVDASAVDTSVVGTYLVTYNAVDASGNAAAEVTRTVEVVDTTVPIITLLGNDPFIVEAGDTYVDPGADVSDTVDTSVAVNVDDSAVNTAVVGTYQVFYNATDASGNPAAEVIRTVEVVDTTAPVITLIGDNPFVVEGATAYVDPGAEVDDTGDPSVAIVVDASGVNTGVVGTYQVVYTATDASGNAATAVTRTVEVIDTTPPIISLVGDNPLVIEAGDPYVEQGALVADTVDPAVALAIDTSAVDTGAVGTYTVVYSAVDASGNAAAPVTRTVEVIDTSAPDLTEFSPPTFSEQTPFILDDDSSTFTLQWSGDIADADPNLDVDCSVGTLISVPPPYVFEYEFPVGTTTVSCTASDTQGNSDTVTFDVTILDQTAPVITLVGDATITLEQGSGPYVDPGATATDNGEEANDLIVIDDSAVDTDTVGSYTVEISATDASGNRSEATRHVIVEASGYAAGYGVIASKTNTRVGRTIYFYWAWLDENGHRVDSSDDEHTIRIENCHTGEVVLERTGLPGRNGFYYFGYYDKWKFKWRTNHLPRGRYCATVTSSLAGQELTSPQIRLR
ncbi:MAG: DUF5011 domain-containing protein, partial [Woeseiaceae bacterium]|nr:DUF5011 domain-containing protein [Woeseiaceae bacterium]